MADSKQQELEQLFEKLSTLLGNSNYAKALKIIDQVLKVSPNDEDAQRCKIVSLLQVGQFDDAIKLLKAGRLADSMPFEKAYCLYRLSRFTEALDALKSVSESQAAAKLQLEAQLHYRLGNAKQCIQAYDAVYQKHKVDSLEVKSNILAAYVDAELAGQIPELMSNMRITAKQSFELGFNKACGLVKTGAYAAAEKELLMALKLGKETLYEDGYTDAEVAEELAPLTVQLGFVLGADGRAAEALERCEEVLKQAGSDAAAVAVAVNNAAVLEAQQAQQEGPAGGSAAAAGGEAPTPRSSRKLHTHLLKKLEKLSDKASTTKFTAALESALSEKQKRAIQFNRAALLLQSGKLDGCRQLTNALAASNPADEKTVLLQASLLAKENKAADADKLLSTAATSGSTSSPIPLPALLRAQLALESNNLQQAAQLLDAVAESSAALQAAPALLATRVALRQQAGDAAGTEALLERAASHWQSVRAAKPRDAAAGEALRWCLLRLVDVKLAADKVPEAVRCYQALRQAGAEEGDSAEVLARLVRATAISGQLGLSSSLQAELPLAPDTSGVDVEALEAAASRTMGGLKKRAAAEETGGKKRAAEASDDQAAAKKKRKKRKPLLPKGYNPELPNGGLPPPDPERWLPKWQRAEFKKKNKRRKDREQQVKGSQGAGQVDENLDRGKAPAGDQAGTSKAPNKPNLPNRPKGKGRK